jgi:hypothetical protein
MKCHFDTPQQFGDLSNRITVDAMQVASVSFNFEPHYRKNDDIIVSIRLIHPESYYTENIIYRDQEGIDFWEIIRTGDHSIECVETKILKKLLADGKLPSGKLIP